MSKNKGQSTQVNASDILGNPDYPAISYGGYRQNTRDIQPTISEIKEDLRILYAMGFRLLRTYNVHLKEASNLLQSIEELKKENPEFEMYVMLGAWIDCKNAWTDMPPIHDEESERNATEIARAVELTNRYPDIVKIIAVGNEAMVHWAAAYFVQPWIILKWVNHLTDLRIKGELPKNLWITSSDNFASWGGGGKEYHNEDLNQLIRAVDFISMHTYPMHDTHYNPQFWGVLPQEEALPDTVKIMNAMLRARDYAVSQYRSVVSYMKSLGIDKPVHIGETGWATHSNEHYGPEGSRATDEYKSGIYYKLMTEWCRQNKVSCFYFEAFDEQWKDSANPSGSENHFGLINLRSEAKYAVWDLADRGVLEGLTRDGRPIRKTYQGNLDNLMKDVSIPPVNQTMQKTER
jgi:exo-beta-1,3-glucanase (GH17 family)